MMPRWLGLARAILRNRQRRTDTPRLLTYTVTFRCNARCVMCDSWRMPDGDELTLKEIEDVFTQLPRLDAVRLTGGEPFLRKDFSDIAALAQRLLQPHQLHISTNGFLTDRIVTFCEQRDKRIPLHLLISVDGVGEKHNQVRGISHAWSSVMETIGALAPQQKRLGIRLAVNQTIVDAEGVEHCRELHRVLRPYGVPNYVVMAYDVSATYNVDRDIDVAPGEIGQFSTYGEFSDESLFELLREANSNVSGLPLIERLAKRYYLLGVRSRLLEGSATPNPPCVALNAHLRIFPNGDVPTCQFNSRVVGNLKEKRFDDVWRGRCAEEQRKWVRRCPGCWAECEVLPSAIYTLDLLSSSAKLSTGRRLTRARRQSNDLRSTAASE